MNTINTEGDTQIENYEKERSTEITSNRSTIQEQIDKVAKEEVAPAETAYKAKKGEMDRELEAKKTEYRTALEAEEAKISDLNAKIRALEEAKAKKAEEEAAKKAAEETEESQTVPKRKGTKMYLHGENLLKTKVLQVRFTSETDPPVSKIEKPVFKNSKILGLTIPDMGE